MPGKCTAILRWRGAVARPIFRAWKLLIAVAASSNDKSTEAGRANERQRRVALSALAAALAKCLSIATALISVPLTLHYLGAERYGMWMTMSSLVAMFSFADLGIGSGILNAVSGAYGRKDFSAIKEYVSSGVFVLSGVAIGIVTVFAAFYAYVPWYEIFNVSSIEAKNDAGPALAVLVACFAFAIPLGVVQRVQMGLQEGFMANLWQCFSSLLALAFVILAIWLNAGLPWLVLAFAGCPLLASLVNSIVYFGWLRPKSAPSLRYVSRGAMKNIAHIGILFLALQIAGAIAYTSDNIVITQILGAEAVAGYAVAQRLFGIIPTLLMMVLTPLWPAYREAIVSGDSAWVRMMLKRSLLMSIGFAGLVSLIFVVLGPSIIHLWVGNAVVTPFVLLLGLGLWQVIQAGGNAVAMFLNGANAMKFQVIIAVVTGVVAICIKIILVEKIGAAGAAWGTIIAFIVCAAVPVYMKLSSIVVRQTGGT